MFVRSSVPASICFNRKLSARSQRWQPAHLHRRIGSFYVGSRLSKADHNSMDWRTGSRSRRHSRHRRHERTPQREKFLGPPQLLNRLKQIDGAAPVSINDGLNQTRKIPNSNPGSKRTLARDPHRKSSVSSLTNGNFQAAGRHLQSLHRIDEIASPATNRSPCACRAAIRLTAPARDSLPKFSIAPTPPNQFLTIDSSVMNILRQRHILTALSCYGRVWRGKIPKIHPLPFLRHTIEDIRIHTSSVSSAGNSLRLFRALEAQAGHPWMSTTRLPSPTGKQRSTPPSASKAHDDDLPPARLDSKRALVELIDYAVQKYGTKVKFLTFREAQERLNQNHSSLASHLRVAAQRPLTSAVVRSMTFEKTADPTDWI